MTAVFANALGILAGAPLLWIINRRSADPLNLANIFTFCYLPLLLLSQLVFDSLLGPDDRLQPDTLLLFYGAWCAFLAAFVLTPPHRPLLAHGDEPSTPRPLIPPVAPQRGIAVLVFLIIANLVYDAVVLWRNGALSLRGVVEAGAMEMMAQHRIETSADLETSHVGWYLELWHNAYLFYVPLALYLIRLRHLSRRWFLPIFALACLSTLVLFARIFLVMLGVVTCYAWWVLFRPSITTLFRYVAYGVGASLALFIAMQSALLRHDTRATATLFDQVVTYSLFPVLAYQALLQGHYQQPNPHGALYTLQPLYYFLGKLGFLASDEYPIGFREYVYYPYVSNVFTFLDGFTLDFGVWGALAGPLVFGLIVSTASRKVRLRPTYASITIAGLCAYCCVVVVLANVLFTHVFVLWCATASAIGWIITPSRRSVAPHRHLASGRRSQLSQRAVV